MANYFARVEVFDCSREEYEKLHDAMEAIGFNKTITGDSGSAKALPDGTYVGSSSDDVTTVKDLIKKTAKPFSSKGPAIFVCRYDDWAAFLYPAS
ncbi:Uncharacterised protein [Serratia fonticola]|uniref:DUF2622 domain-containing protein n=1 Tax=Serratia fonticola TaxID=47917 RepID=A0A3S5AZG0_SERFO|nr:type V toxin-antitoxin system endoribonuclease antitoxin GhoS [Serratia fonticola]CAI1819527.1 Uncharacterised protein [Serratia fonticola]VEI69408.1 Uncharacterised protein [Serratia fonticola]